MVSKEEQVWRLYHSGTLRTILETNTVAKVSSEAIELIEEVLSKRFGEGWNP